MKHKMRFALYLGVVIVVTVMFVVHFWNTEAEKAHPIYQVLSDLYTVPDESRYQTYLSDVESIVIEQDFLPESGIGLVSVDVDFCDYFAVEPYLTHDCIRRLAERDIFFFVDRLALEKGVAVSVTDITWESQNTTAPEPYKYYIVSVVYELSAPEDQQNVEKVHEWEIYTISSGDSERIVHMFLRP